MPDPQDSYAYRCESLQYPSPQVVSQAENNIYDPAMPIQTVQILKDTTSWLQMNMVGVNLG